MRHRLINTNTINTFVLQLTQRTLLSLLLPQVYPEAGTVSFSAGLHGWAFTLTVFAKLYAKKFGVEEKKMMERLWGDNFFDPATKKWTNKVGLQQGGAGLCGGWGLLGLGAAGVGGCWGWGR